MAFRESGLTLTESCQMPLDEWLVQRVLLSGPLFSNRPTTETQLFRPGQAPANRVGHSFVHATMSGI